MLEQLVSFKRDFGASNKPTSKVGLKLAYEYEVIGQFASAISYYLEAVDNAISSDEIYTGLLRAAICFYEQGGRDLTTIDLLKSASTVSNAVEVNYMLSKVYERLGWWMDSYVSACAGLEVHNYRESLIPVKDAVYYGVLFQKAVAAWWIGKAEMSRELMYTIYNESPKYRDLAFTNLRSIGYPKDAFALTKHNCDDAYVKTNITRNYSQSAQDMFVLQAIPRKGTYLEIGCGHPIKFNNTYLLEKKCWTGLSLDIEYKHIAEFNLVRDNPGICQDALTYHYEGTPENLDYLQVDCEPPNITFDILKVIMKKGIRPKVITFEHDRYIAGDEIANLSRDYLSNLGYILKVKDVKFDRENSQYEDWWILPEVEVNVPRYAENILGIDYILKNSS